MLVPSSYVAPVTIAVCATRDRARALARAAFPRRRCRLVLTRTAAELERTFREMLVDAAVLDVHSPSDDAWQAVGLAAEFPSAPFFALTPLRPSDAAIIARCAAAEVADLVTEGVDDGVLRDLVLPRTFTARFTDALRDPPSTLSLGGQLHLATWRFLVAHGGRSVRTDTIAAALGVTREHLSRAFSAGGSANLKRIIDLVRLMAAAELAKNPGYDVADVARVLEYASSSHLSTTSQRIAGTKPASLARLRGVDLIDRFVKGRTRSRG
ncbi:MAG TPA: helix-turn-helix domain-containing protein [Gemmatimonadaceae bacterium]|nr:helix-turn-helix domain-containing protein [Gemmatimonadaceae bacterium]